jgi:glycosyltransferase involved in cell wall biosynthesis
MAQRLLAQGVDAEFVILGEGEEEPALRALARRLGVQRRVTFTPFVHHSQIAGLGLLVEPSVIEGLGLSVLQAMALGTPVAAAGAGGVFDLVDDGVTGLLAPPNDADGLARTVRRLLDDPAGALEMARQARDRVERHFDAGSAARAALEFYAGEIGRRR